MVPYWPRRRAAADAPFSFWLSPAADEIPIFAQAAQRWCEQQTFADCRSMLFRRCRCIMLSIYADRCRVRRHMRRYAGDIGRAQAGRGGGERAAQQDALLLRSIASPAAATLSPLSFRRRFRLPTFARATPRRRRRRCAFPPRQQQSSDSHSR